MKTIWCGHEGCTFLMSDKQTEFSIGESGHYGAIPEDPFSAGVALAATLGYHAIKEHKGHLKVEFDAGDACRIGIDYGEVH